ncbi:uncharacterized protein KZ484_017830 [Pholidichthys leucotaenia]
MPGAHCAVVKCGNSVYHLERWKKQTCSIHACNFGTSLCTCPPPFMLYTFPTELKDPDGHNCWIKAVNRKNLKTGKRWEPTRNSRVCSVHFIGGKPSKECPDPCLNLEHQPHQSTTKKWKEPPTRSAVPASKKKILPSTENSASPLDMNEENIFTENAAASSDHVYGYECDCSTSYVPQQNDSNQEEIVDEQQLLNQERNFIVVQVGADCSQMKEEQEDVCISQEGEQFGLKQETQTFDEDVPQQNDSNQEEVVDEQQLVVAKEMNINDFAGGPSWCYRFMQRKSLSISG